MRVIDTHHKLNLAAFGILNTLQRLTKKKLVTEIQSINVRTSLVYYLLWRIDASNELHLEARSKRRNPAYFDCSTNQRITALVKECVDIYNRTHKRGAPWTFAEMIYFLKFVWQKETKDYLDAKALSRKL